jgi:hypothetical protein
VFVPFHETQVRVDNRQPIRQAGYDALPLYCLGSGRLFSCDDGRVCMCQGNLVSPYSAPHPKQEAGHDQYGRDKQAIDGEFPRRNEHCLFGVILNPLNVERGHLSLNMAVKLNTNSCWPMAQ